MSIIIADIGQANLKLLVIGVLDADNVILSVNTLSNGSATGKHLWCINYQILPVPSSIENEDYRREEFNFTLKLYHNIIQLDIINDSVLEPTEHFFVQVSLLEESSRIHLNTSLVQIYILDDECKLVSLMCEMS